MPENSIHSSLIHSFPKPNKEIWKRAASAEIDGSDPLKILSWKTGDGIIFFPYYDFEDISRFDYLKHFRLAVSENSFSGPRKWACVPFISAQQENKGNKISLEHLANGGDGIYFGECAADTDLNALLNGIAWQYCSLFFQPLNNSTFSEGLQNHISAQKIIPDALTGAIFWESIPKKNDVEFFVSNTKNFKPLGVVIQSAPASAQIADALIRGLKLFETFSDSVSDSRDIFHAITFSIPVDNNFLETIAKLKALRLLWFQISQAFGIKNFIPADLHIHARSEAWVSENYQPHGNMIKSTTAGMASILGGCDSLTVHPEDNENNTMSRIARNVSAILREESHLNIVADPMAGSYAADAMTHAIAEHAWSLFQNEMKK